MWFEGKIKGGWGCEGVIRQRNSCLWVGIIGEKGGLNKWCYW